MRTHRLTRFAETVDGVFGRFDHWLTVEEEWQANKSRISCIPTGIYKCVRTTYHKGGYETFEITGVLGRSRILFHKANTEEDVEGCIGIADQLGVLKVVDEDTKKPTHKLAGLSSGPAFAAFMKSFEGVDEWVLEVVNYRWAA